MSESKSIGVAQPPPLLLDQMEYNFDMHRDGRWEYVDQEDPIVHTVFLPRGLSEDEVPHKDFEQ